MFFPNVIYLYECFHLILRDTIITSFITVWSAACQTGHIHLNSRWHSFPLLVCMHQMRSLFLLEALWIDCLSDWFKYLRSQYLSFFGCDIWLYHSAIKLSFGATMVGMFKKLFLCQGMNCWQLEHNSPVQVI